MTTTRVIFTRSLLTTQQTLSSILSSLLRLLRCFFLHSPSFLSLHPPPLPSSPSQPTSTASRGYANLRTSSSLNGPNSNLSNRSPKEMVLLDGCDFNHWLVILENPKSDTPRDEIIDSYINPS
ncbi:hypothetical protein RHMOL_Rhmol03G0074200 [Rhododendron molle]|uniref:Uncharacterized protein n=1 Tax=Rhododendron molle TaxID=49168 RepID=A0ACC0PBP6_RHOML|nr:hypothetical protein RHMOL_Rhmol03G0074200 [Rhododendron molle]